MTTSLSKRGYTVLKEDLTSSEILKIRQELTVKPFVNTSYGGVAVPFPVYCESKRKLYMPRYSGQKKYGIPTTNRIEQGSFPGPRGTNEPHSTRGGSTGIESIPLTGQAKGASPNLSV
mgnify:CR=1 FL=1